jgi:hypothetical protein
LDADPVVRRMAEQDILVMGKSAKDYLDEQRTKAKPDLKAAIDSIWRRVLDDDRWDGLGSVAENSTRPSVWVHQFSGLNPVASNGHCAHPREATCEAAAREQTADATDEDQEATNTDAHGAVGRPCTRKARSSYTSLVTR